MGNSIIKSTYAVKFLIYKCFVHDALFGICNRISKRCFAVPVLRQTMSEWVREEEERRKMYPSSESACSCSTDGSVSHCSVLISPAGGAKEEGKDMHIYIRTHGSHKLWHICINGTHTHT